ncbi:MAG: tetratricopeptide repeat protein [Kiritimatiellae bacterium]|nr:tetratricopeptide repeat protein [Kiritimatiellia bacterium]MDW8458225.1 tetratricopeptide repeat protein [Verrucomicrobiota bacterium]
MVQHLYPRLPWQPGGWLVPPWLGADGPRVKLSWRLDEREGSIWPAGEEDTWGFAWRPSRMVWATPHGVIEYGKDVAGPPAFCAVCPEPDVLWGESDLDHKPTLEGEKPPVPGGPAVQVLETEQVTVRLFLQEEKGRLRFAAVVSRDVSDDGTATWNKYRSESPAAFLAGALSPYLEFARSQSATNESDFRRMEGVVARMIRDLRTGVDPRRLMCIPARSSDRQMRTADVLIAARAWLEVRPSIAMELIRTVFSGQTPDGDLPAFYDELGHPSTETFDRPGFAHIVWLVWQREPDRAWYDEIAPRAVRYVEALIRAMDPDRQGSPRWLRAGDSLVPSIYDTQLRSPDLPALLVREVDALEQLAGAVAVRSLDLGDLLAYRDRLLSRLRSDFWNPELRCFIEQFEDGRPVLRKSITSLVPLVCRQLTREEEQALLDLLVNRDFLLSPAGLLSWSDWSAESESSILPEIQVMFLDALSERRASSQRSTLRGSLLSHLPPGETPAEQALLLVLLSVRAEIHLHTRLISPALNWMNRNRRFVVATIILLAVLINVGVVMYYRLRERTLTLQAVETNIGLARRLYSEGRFAEAEPVMRQVLDSDQPQPTVWFEMGNILYKLGRLDEAAYWYGEQKGPPIIVGQAQHNLAVVRMKQGRLEEARQIWMANQTNYAITAPQVSERATLALKYLPEAGEK